MGVDHVLDAVGDDLARRQRIEHPVVPHRDAVVDRDRVELLGDAARGLDLARDQLPHVLQVDVARHELREGIRDRDDRFAEIPILDAGGPPETPRAGHVATVGGGPGAISGHGSGLWREEFYEKRSIWQIEGGGARAGIAGSILPALDASRNAA